MNDGKSGRPRDFRRSSVQPTPGPGHRLIEVGTRLLGRLVALLHAAPGNRRPGSIGTSRRGRRFAFEQVEPRRLLAAGPAISGYVFVDSNHDGLYQPSETPLAGSTIQLRNAQGAVLGTATSGAGGFYSFQGNPTIPTGPTTLTRTATFADTPTTAKVTGQVAKFDPTLGTLTSITISDAVTLRDQILVESSDPQPAELTATVTGSESLSGPGFSPFATNTIDSVTFDAASYDGDLDFGGTSGHDFGPRSKTANASTTITDPATLAAYTGTGKVTFSEKISAASSIAGTANATQQIRTSGSGTLNVTYTYIRNNALQPGLYTLVQATQPPGGYENEYNSAHADLQPGGQGTNSITLNLTAAGSTDNDFGEAIPAAAQSSLAGFAYLDSNDDGIHQPNEAGLAGVRIQLSGIDTLGRPVSATTTTGSDGSYNFGGLVAGTYSLTKTPPSGYFDGLSTIGSQGGSAASDDVLGSIDLGTGVAGGDNNFAELKPSSLSGSVFFDANNDGIRDGAEYGIAHVDLTLTGADDRGNAVDEVLSTAADGTYTFGNLRPGLYRIAAKQPIFFLGGKVHVGTQGGSQFDRALENLPLAEGVDGVANDFGELPRPGCKLLGLTEYHTQPAHQLASRQIGPKLRFAMPTLIPAITRPGT